jgi:hypothetical protein
MAMNRFFCTHWMAALATGLSSVPSSVQAFPPAPHHTLFGNVRDQYGKLLPSSGTLVRIFAGSGELAPQPLFDVPSGDYNYQIRVRMDMARPDTNSYHPQVLNKDSVLNLKVEMGGRTYLPIEMKRPTTVGESSTRRRLDLTLGVDRDDDGLPDAWEESQLYQAGEPAGQDGWDLSKLDRDGDYDADGSSNWQEYLSGTYALDATSILDLRILEKTDSLARLEFYSFYGKGYTLEGSTDLKSWTPVAFTLAPPSAAGVAAEALTSLTANTTGPTSLYVVTSGPILHYRLLAR